MKPVYMLQICRLYIQDLPNIQASQIYLFYWNLFNIRGKQASELTNSTARGESRKESEENQMTGCNTVYYTFPSCLHWKHTLICSKNVTNPQCEQKGYYLLSFLRLCKIFGKEGRYKKDSEIRENLSIKEIKKKKFKSGTWIFVSSSCGECLQGEHVEWYCEKWSPQIHFGGSETGPCEHKFGSSLARG